MFINYTISLGQETVKGSFAVQVKLLAHVHLSTTQHGGGFTMFRLINKRQAEML